jgi:hypothetical protein
MGHMSAAQKRAQTKYESSAIQKKKRAARNKARRHMIKAGKAHKGDGMDVEHINGNALDNRPGNWRMGTKRHNRSYPRTKRGHKKNPRD